MNILTKLEFGKAAISSFLLHPHQDAIADRIKAVIEIGKYLGVCKKNKEETKSLKDIIGKAYCNMKK